MFFLCCCSKCTVAASTTCLPPMTTDCCCWTMKIRNSSDDGGSYLITTKVEKKAWDLCGNPSCKCIHHNAVLGWLRLFYYLMWQAKIFSRCGGASITNNHNSYNLFAFAIFFVWVVRIDVLLFVCLKTEISGNRWRNHYQKDAHTYQDNDLLLIILHGILICSSTSNGSTTSSST